MPPPRVRIARNAKDSASAKRAQILNCSTTIRTTIQLVAPGDQSDQRDKYTCSTPVQPTTNEVSSPKAKLQEHIETNEVPFLRIGAILKRVELTYPAELPGDSEPYCDEHEWRRAWILQRDQAAEVVESSGLVAQTIYSHITMIPEL